MGKLETIVAGSSSTTTTYYYAGALRIAEAVNGTFSYLGNDVLGSTAVALNASGQLTAAQLYGPYGNVRYSSGTMPTDIGFTGQRGDSATGLDYYNARYYDPVVGLFISADTVLPGNGFDPWGLSRYAYVQGNPETLTYPTGRRFAPPIPGGCSADGSCGGGDSGSPPPPSLPPGPVACNSTGCFSVGGIRVRSFVHTPSSHCGCKVVLNNDPPHPTAKQILTGQKAAQQTAKDAAKFFRNAAIFVGAVAGIAGIAFGMFLADNPVLALFFAGVATQATILLAQLLSVQAIFSDEAENDLSWFTEANVNREGGKAMAILAGEAGLGLLTSFSMAMSKASGLMQAAADKFPAFMGGSLLVNVLGTGVAETITSEYVRAQSNAVLT